jgi:ATP-dependent DNA helicase RecQ
MSPPDPDTVARDALGITLRPPQREAVDAVVAGRDTLVVMPTGSGKSAIYQVAGMLVEGPTVVVSPLIALQRDQLDALDESDAAPAAVLNSAVPAAERREALQGLARDRLEYLLLAPEQLAKPEVRKEIAAARPSLFVVDEAHCISEWGHDFRPDYLRLGAVAEELGRPTVLALTATASPPVRAEIQERLRMRDAFVLVRGFDRPNIWLGAETFVHEDAKRAALLDATEAEPKPGIVYAATRARSEELADELEHRGLAARAYHGGMPKREREEAQEAFMDGDLDVIVATTAFGMGVDKPDVRFVFHLDVSDSVDAYYQEIGRAGRDGAHARARLFFRPEDLGLRRFFAGSGGLDVEEVERVVEAVRRHAGPVDPSVLQEETGLTHTKVAAAVSRLEEVGAVEVQADGEVVASGATEDDAAAHAAAAQESRREFDRSRVEMMRGYAEVRDCRREYLLNYFGEPVEQRCGNCDRCDAGIADDPVSRPFALGARVRHERWGDGAVQRYEADKMVVLFDEAGYRTLAVELVLENGLLEPE